MRKISSRTAIAFLAVLIIGLMLIPSASALTYISYASNEYKGQSVPVKIVTPYLDMPSISWTGDWMDEDTPSNLIITSSATVLKEGLDPWGSDGTRIFPYRAGSGWDWDAISTTNLIRENRPNILVWTPNQYGYMQGSQLPYLEVDSGGWHVTEWCECGDSEGTGDWELCGPGFNEMEVNRKDGTFFNTDEWTFHGEYPPWSEERMVAFRASLAEPVWLDLDGKMPTFQPQGEYKWKNPKMPYGVILALDKMHDYTARVSLSTTQATALSAFEKQPTYLEKYAFSYAFHDAVGRGMMIESSFKYAALTGSAIPEEGTSVVECRFLYAKLPYSNPDATGGDLNFRKIESVYDADVYLDDTPFSVTLDRTNYQAQGSLGVWITIITELDSGGHYDSHFNGDLTVEIRKTFDDGQSWSDFVVSPPDPEYADRDIEDRVYYLDEQQYSIGYQDGWNDNSPHIDTVVTTWKPDMISIYISDYWMSSSTMDAVKATLIWDHESFEFLNLVTIEIAEAWV